jgi:hypothetical protein
MCVTPTKWRATRQCIAHSGNGGVIVDDNATSLWQATRQDLIKKHADMQALRDQLVAATRVQL